MRPPLDAAWLQQRGYRLDGDRAVPATSTGPVPEMPEDTLLAAVRRLAKVYGWVCYHTHTSTRSEPGFVDCVITDGESLLMYELKTNTGKLTPEQAVWVDLLQHTGKVEAGVWRPRDLPMIEARLSRRQESPHG